MNKSGASEYKGYPRDPNSRPNDHSYRLSTTPNKLNQSSRDLEAQQGKVDSMYLLVNRMREENSELKLQLSLKSQQCEELKVMYNEACQVTLEYQAEFQNVFQSLNEQKHLNQSQAESQS